MNTKAKILEFMKEKAYKPMLKEELAKIFDIEKSQRKEFYRILNELETDGKIVRTRHERYGIPEKMNLFLGKIQGHERGFGFLIPEDENSEDIFIPAADLNGALHGDKVLVRVMGSSKEGKKKEGEVIRIIERVNSKIVGTFENSRNFGFVVPDDKRISMDVFIPKPQFNGAKSNQKVVVEITKWPEKRRNPEGKVIEVLGDSNDVGTDILAIMKQYDLNSSFPEKVLRYAESIPEEIDDEEIRKRVDLREKSIFTIDGPDAKDLDDAVSIEKLDNGNYKLGVHIADVTHYVKENSPLDKEALKRGTSVYLLDRVVPMLPPKLSNGVCSLNPNVPRLALSVFMEINKEGNVVEYEIFESVIESKERLVYDDISNYLENDDQKVKERYSHIINELELMQELSIILTKKRERRGSIDFDFSESKIVLDEKGKPIDVKLEERRIANRIIEEFMLVCNETIAENMYWSQIPFVYRIHEDPDMEKIDEFNKFIHNFGYHFKGSNEIHPKELQSLIKKVKGTREETVINTLMLRSLKKAKYSPDSVGHFGLAARYYCHFTSPIRRYPDLQIHRIIKWFINGWLSEKRMNNLEKKLPGISEQCSLRERVADEAEREVEDLKKAEYMLDKIGEEYDGIISSITHFGMFVELENTIEGLVHVSSLTDDYYHFDEVNYCFIGEMTKKTYSIGDYVRIKVANASTAKREIDFILVENEELDKK